MPVHAITPSALRGAFAGGASEQIRAWCAALEAGGLLYFPETPLPIPADDLEILLGLQQPESKLHKNISYKPMTDELSGVDVKTSQAATVHRVHDVMRRYSQTVERFLTRFLAPYRQRWVLDYASYRPYEESERDLSLQRRNNLLHTDAFPIRPTRGWRILRFFHNIHPTRTRHWVVGEPFPRVVGSFAPDKIAIPHRDSILTRGGKMIATATGLASLVPQWKRTPYDKFMMQLHNAMKESAEFQETCVKEHVEFAPGSSWIVYTETVPHAVVAGQYALEQTFLVDPAATVTPESAPVAVLEKMAGARLV